MVAQVEDDDYYHIVSVYGGKRYRVFNISKFDKGYDGKKTYLTIAARRLKDIPSTVFRASQNLMFNVVITYNNIPRYMVEPRTSASRLLAARLGVEDVGELRDIINGGNLINLLELVPAEVEDERDAALKKTKIMRKRLTQQVKKISELASEKEILVQRNGTVLGDISRIRDELCESANIRVAQQNRIQQREHALKLAGTEVPPYR